MLKSHFPSLFIGVGTHTKIISDFSASSEIDLQVQSFEMSKVKILW